jgi:hypothetical protein
MIIEKSHLAGLDGWPQRCQRCGAIVSTGKPYHAGTRVGVILGKAAETLSHYAITEERETTPPICSPAPSYRP